MWPRNANRFSWNFIEALLLPLLYQKTYLTAFQASLPQPSNRCVRSKQQTQNLTRSADWLASFPGSPRARTKNRKERGEPGKIYHVRNVTGREDLIARGRIKPQHSVRPLVMQVSFPGRWRFCYTICKFRKSLWSSFWRPWRQTKKTPLQRREWWTPKLTVDQISWSTDGEDSCISDMARQRLW